MQRFMHIGWLAGVMLLLAGCQESPDRALNAGIGPKPEEMRKALLTLMDTHPEIDVPEFRVSLEDDVPVERGGMVYIGSWNCDPKLMSFDALFTAPNITMFEVAGRFEKDNRDIWVAIPRKIQKTQNRDIGEFWRPHEVRTY